MTKLKSENMKTEMNVLYIFEVYLRVSEPVFDHVQRFLTTIIRPAQQLIQHLERTCFRNCNMSLFYNNLMGPSVSLMESM